MSTTKSTIVTVIVTVLLGIAAYGAYRLCMPAFIILTAAFAAIGLLASAMVFCAWLSEADEVGQEENTPAAPFSIKTVEEALREGFLSVDGEETESET